MNGLVEIQTETAAASPCRLSRSAAEAVAAFTASRISPGASTARPKVREQQRDLRGGGTSASGANDVPRRSSTTRAPTTVEQPASPPHVQVPEL